MEVVRLMLIGLCGYPGSGKSEVRNILVEKHGFIHVDTKEKIKLMSAILTMQHVSTFESQEGKATLYEGHTNRKIMGEVGNAVEKLFGDEYLLNKSLEHYRNLYHSTPLIVDSLRKDQTRNFPGMVVQVVSNKAQEPKDDFDRFYQGRTNAIIVNDGTVEELAETVKRVLWL